MRTLGRLQSTVPAPKQALLSNIFNEELSELRIVADITTMKAKINRLLPIVSAMVGVFLGMQLLWNVLRGSVAETNAAYRIVDARVMGDD